LLQLNGADAEKVVSKVPNSIKTQRLMKDHNNPCSNVRHLEIMLTPLPGHMAQSDVIAQTGNSSNKTT
jgi:hypothetical protein